MAYPNEISPEERQKISDLRLEEVEKETTARLASSQIRDRAAAEWTLRQQERTKTLEGRSAESAKFNEEMNARPRRYEGR